MVSKDTRWGDLGNGKRYYKPNAKIHEDCEVRVRERMRLPFELALALVENVSVDVNRVLIQTEVRLTLCHQWSGCRPSGCTSTCS
jgi:hypothetical protein